MKIRRFQFTVPLAVIVNAAMDFLLGVLALVTSIMTLPIMLTKELCGDEMNQERKYEAARAKEILEALKAVEEKEPEVKS